MMKVSEHGPFKKVEGVMGVIEDETLVVVGPGTVNSSAAEMEGLTGLRIGECGASSSFGRSGQEMKSEMKKKNNTPVKTFKKIGSIFIPLIPVLLRQVL